VLFIFEHLFLLKFNLVQDRRRLNVVRIRTDAKTTLRIICRYRIFVVVLLKCLLNFIYSGFIIAVTYFIFVENLMKRQE